MDNNENSKPAMTQRRLMIGLGIGVLLVVVALAHKQPYFWIDFSLALVAFLLLPGAAYVINGSKTSEGAEKNDGDVGNPK